MEIIVGDTYIWPGKELFFSTMERVVDKNIKNIPFDEIHNVSEVLASGPFFKYLCKIFRQTNASYNSVCWRTLFCFIDSKDSLILLIEHINVIKNVNLLALVVCVNDKEKIKVTRTICPAK